MGDAVVAGQGRVARGEPGEGRGIRAADDLRVLLVLHHDHHDVAEVGHSPGGGAEGGTARGAGGQQRRQDETQNGRA